MILKINDRFKNREVRYFTDVVLDLKYDAFASTFQLSYRFDPDNAEIRELSCVSHFHICQIFTDDLKLVLTGFILSNEFESQSEEKLVRIGGYSLPGVLEDCNIPVTIPAKFSKNQALAPYSLQSYGLTLREIAKNLTEPFGIKIVVEKSVAEDMDSPYRESEVKETETIKNYLSELASQKNIIITHNEYGNLVFKRPSTSQKPILNFTDETIGLTKMKLSFNGQAVHSQITVMNQADFYDSSQAEQQVIYNPYCTTVFRPKTIKLSQRSENTQDSESAARNVRARELRALSLLIELDRLVVNDVLLKVGSVISVTNPNVYLYNKSNFFIDSIDVKQTPETEVVSVQCCLPEAISGDDPVYIFRGINQHPLV